MEEADNSDFKLDMLLFEAKIRRGYEWFDLRDAKTALEYFGMIFGIKVDNIISKTPHLKAVFDEFEKTYEDKALHGNTRHEVSKNLQKVLAH